MEDYSLLARVAVLVAGADCDAPALAVLADF